MATLNDLLTALNRRCRFEIPDPSDMARFIQQTPNQIRIIGRIRSDGTTANMANWLLLMNALFERAEKPGVTWKADISKWYFRRGGKIVFAWRVLLQGDAIAERITEITTVVNSSPVTSRAEVEEIALPGVGRANRNTNQNGRGAGYAGKVAVGPMAIAALVAGKGG
jgi:hypothetical protein